LQLSGFVHFCQSLSLFLQSLSLGNSLCPDRVCFRLALCFDDCGLRLALQAKLFSFGGSVKLLTFGVASAFWTC
jgi:hypothetical protein